MGLTSISLATQQGLALSRICCYEDSCQKIQSTLGKHMNDKPVPRRRQLFLWQTPIMLLNIGLLAYVVGLIIQIFAELELVWSSSDIKVPNAPRAP